jgi:hypothetical protein
MQQIVPQEFNLLQDSPCIRTKCPQRLVTDEMVARRVKHGNLVAGDTVLVQCMSSDYSELLAECEYRVISRKSELKTYEINDHNTRQAEEITFKVQRWSEWRYVGPPAEAPGMRAVWNFGKKRYDITAGDVIVGFHADKETANRIAAGELPLEASPLGT